MSTISYGDDSPVASNKTRVGRAQNRRVVVVVLA
jgi:outer membrane protein OmpA-like peptidoglycan-associated protein